MDASSCPQRPGGGLALPSRAAFLRDLAALAGAWALLPLVNSGCAGRRITKEGRKVAAIGIEYPGHTGQVRAHLAFPDRGEKLGAVVVIHENRGLNDHIRDVTNRAAAAGFLAMAPDALSPVGGTPADPDEARSRIGALNPDDTVQDFVAALQYVRTHPQSNGRVGCVGFCWGGAMANQLAVSDPQLDAAVPYYGRPPAAADVPRIRAALLLHYAGLDDRINAGIPAYRQALDAAGAEYQLHMYEGAKHAFNNDTSPDRYHPEAARLAWQRTLEFLQERLQT